MFYCHHICLFCNVSRFVKGCIIQLAVPNNSFSFAKLLFASNIECFKVISPLLAQNAFFVSKIKSMLEHAIFQNLRPNIEETHVLPKTVNL